MLQFSYYAECHFADCHYTECHYAECRYPGCRDANMTCSYNVHCYKTVQLNVDNLVQATETFSDTRPYVSKTLFISDLSHFCVKLG
jgi:hypothetical protein